jgi:hypothetical protein
MEVSTPLRLLTHALQEDGYFLLRLAIEGPSEPNFASAFLELLIPKLGYWPAVNPVRLGVV